MFVSISDTDFKIFYTVCFTFNKGLWSWDVPLTLMWDVPRGNINALTTLIYILSLTMFCQNNSISNRVIERINKRTTFDSYAIYPLNNSIYQIIFERQLLKTERKIHNILAYMLKFYHLNRCILILWNLRTLKKKKLNSNIT